jgi:hypothetical protein
MDRPRRDSRQHNGITVRGLSQLTSATKSAISGFVHPSKQHLYSITSSARLSSAGDEVDFTAAQIGGVLTITKIQKK